jgi:hypothetical protein
LFDAHISRARLIFVVIAASIVATAMALPLQKAPAYASSQPNPVPLPRSAPSVHVPKGIVAQLKGPAQTSPGSCSTVRSHFAAYAANGQKRVACIESVSSRPSGRVSGSTSRAGVAPMAPYPNPGSQCALAGQINVWFQGRDWLCYEDYGKVITTYDPRTGQPIGSATYTITHASGFDAYSATWSNPTCRQASRPSTGRTGRPGSESCSSWWRTPSWR